MHYSETHKGSDNEEDSDLMDTDEGVINGRTNTLS